MHPKVRPTYGPKSMDHRPCFIQWNRRLWYRSLLDNVPNICSHAQFWLVDSPRIRPRTLQNNILERLSLICLEEPALDYWICSVLKSSKSQIILKLNPKETILKWSLITSEWITFKNSKIFCFYFQVESKHVFIYW